MNKNKKRIIFAVSLTIVVVIGSLSYLEYRAGKTYPILPVSEIQSAVNLSISVTPISHQIITINNSVRYPWQQVSYIVVQPGFHENASITLNVVGANNHSSALYAFHNFVLVGGAVYSAPTSSPNGSFIYSYATFGNAVYSQLRVCFSDVFIFFYVYGYNLTNEHMLLHFADNEYNLINK